MASCHRGGNKKDAHITTCWEERMSVYRWRQHSQGSTKRLLRLNNEGGNQKHWYFICKSGSDLFFFKLASLMNRLRGKSSTYSWPFYMNEQSNECTNKWISGQVCQQDYITASFDFLSYTRTKLTCRNSTVYERRTKDKGQDGGLVS